MISEDDSKALRVEVDELKARLAAQHRAQLEWSQQHMEVKFDQDRLLNENKRLAQQVKKLSTEQVTSDIFKELEDAKKANLAYRNTVDIQEQKLKNIVHQIQAILSENKFPEYQAEIHNHTTSGIETSPSDDIQKIKREFAAKLNILLPLFWIGYAVRQKKLALAEHYVGSDLELDLIIEGNRAMYLGKPIEDATIIIFDEHHELREEYSLDMTQLESYRTSYGVYPRTAWQYRKVTKFIDILAWYDEIPRWIENHKASAYLPLNHPSLLELLDKWNHYYDKARPLIERIEKNQDLLTNHIEMSLYLSLREIGEWARKREEERVREEYADRKKKTKERLEHWKNDGMV